jgi:hypothetical protein
MNIERVKGDTYADEFTLTLKANWQPANLTGCTATLSLDRVESPTDSTTQVYTLAGEIPDPLTGKIMFAPTKAQSNQTGRFYFKVKVIDQTGKERTVATGLYVYL